MKKLKYIAPLLIAVACLGFQQAKADTVNYSLGTANDPALGGGPFGNVLVNLTAPNTATITFTAAVGYLFVNGGAVAVNVNATSWTVSAFTVNPGATAVTDSGARNEDGFGSFNQTGSQQNANNGASLVTFTLTNSGTWASAANVLAFNENNWLVAAHIFLVGSNGITGFAAGPAGGTIPDGGTTVMLLGAALGALGMARRFIKS
jgi:VPDSG-CTERM motif